MHVSNASAVDAADNIAGAKIAGAKSPAGTNGAKLHLPRRIKSALRAFLTAVDYADDLRTSVWDFALEMPSLHRMRLSDSDLRWLVGRGLLEHALEVTQPGDADRSFRRPPRLLICKSTCFVISPSGIDLARDLAAPVKPPKQASPLSGQAPVLSGPADALSASESRLLPMTPSQLIPRWDSDRQELKVGSIVVKRFRVPAASQEMILAAFEEESWPPRIDDPLPPRDDQSPKRRLQETIKSLNRNQKRHVIRFLGDGNGQGVLWELRADKENGRASGDESISGEDEEPRAGDK